MPTTEPPTRFRNWPSVTDPIGSTSGPEVSRIELAVPVTLPVMAVHADGLIDVATLSVSVDVSNQNVPVVTTDADGSVAWIKIDAPNRSCGIYGSTVVLSQIVIAPCERLVAAPVPMLPVPLVSRNTTACVPLVNVPP